MKTTPSTTSPAIDDAAEDGTKNTTEDGTKNTTEDGTENTTEGAATDGGGVPDRARSSRSTPGDDAFEDEEPEPGLHDERRAQAGAGSGAAAVVAAGLGVVSLTGAWTGRVVAERETLIGQIKTSGGGSASRQIAEIYGDAWHSTALVNGLFALLALLVGAFVLVRPAFGAPAPRPRPGWIRSVALGGVALGALGVLISAGMYLDLIVSLPRAGG